MHKIASVFWRLTIFGFVLLSTIVQVPSTDVALSEVASSIAAATFAPISIGAGGFVTNINIVGDGTKVVRTDTFGAWGCYKCSNSTGRWSQLINYASLPADDLAATFGQNPNETGCCGVYEIVIAPSNSSVAYMYYNGFIFVTTNLDTCANAQCPGLKWTRTRFPRAAANPNSKTKILGPMMAVDPANVDIVYAGTPSGGLFKTTNGTGGSLSTWTPIISVGAGNTTGSGYWGPLDQGGGNLICFDQSSAVADRVTQGIFVSTYGKGVYHSADGGATWFETANSPTTHIHMVCDQNGSVWLTDNSHKSGQNLSRYSEGIWRSVTTSLGNGMRNASIAVDPTTSGRTTRIVLGIDAGNLNISVNNGLTWTDVQWESSRTAPDIPWLSWTNETYMTNGNQAFDPGQSNVLMFAEGIGVWWSHPSNTNQNPTLWTSQSAAIEQLVANSIISPWCASCVPLLSSWDRAFWRVTNPLAYPSTHGASNKAAIAHGWSVDWAGGAPSTVVGIINGDESGISTAEGLTSLVSISIGSPAVVTCVGCDLIAGTKFRFLPENGRTASLPTGIAANKAYFVLSEGLTTDSFEFSTSPTGSANSTSGSQSGQTSVTTWIPFAGGIPDDRPGGCIAAASPSNFLWVDTSSGGGPWYTTDSGATWTDLAGYFNANFAIPTTGNRGWGFAYFVFTIQCAADRVNPNTFLLYNATPPGAFYRSRNGGATWTKEAAGFVERPQITATLKSVPGQAGNYFYTPGMQITKHPAGTHLWKTINGGSTWSTCPGVMEAWSVGFGAARPGGDGYPAVYIYGWIHDVGGVWRSDDGCMTWTQMSNLHPANTVDEVRSIEGDANIYGNVYLGFVGSGWIYGRLN